MELTISSQWQSKWVFYCKIYLLLETPSTKKVRRVGALTTAKSISLRIQALSKAHLMAFPTQERMTIADLWKIWAWRWEEIC